MIDNDKNGMVNGMKGKERERKIKGKRRGWKGRYQTGKKARKKVMKDEGDGKNKGEEEEK